MFTNGSITPKAARNVSRVLTVYLVTRELMLFSLAKLDLKLGRTWHSSASLAGWNNQATMPAKTI